MELNIASYDSPCIVSELICIDFQKMLCLHLFFCHIFCTSFVTIVRMHICLYFDPRHALAVYVHNIKVNCLKGEHVVSCKVASDCIGQVLAKLTFTICHWHHGSGSFIRL